MVPAGYAAASNELDLTLGGINTAVLIASSLTVAMAVHSAQEGKQGQIVGFLSATLVLGVVFLVIKYFEYKAKFHLHEAHHAAAQIRLFPASAGSMWMASSLPSRTRSGSSWCCTSR